MPLPIRNPLPIEPIFTKLIKQVIPMASCKGSMTP